MTGTAPPHPANAWLLLAAGDNRQHGGNDGYDDDIAAHYSWDDTVPNHASILVGDMVALWEKHWLLGVSVVEAIHIADSQKPVHRCPACTDSKIKPRATKTPLYRCHSCSAEFDSPSTSMRDVTTYRSRHDAGWVDLGGRLVGSELRALCEKPKSQHSMRRLRSDDFLAALSRSAQATDRLNLFARRSTPSSDGHSNATVRVRRGQHGFRQRLLEKFGSVCAVTGPQPAAVLEAAHLYSYAALGVHHENGGLLLRRDIHTLFDLGLLAVDPASSTVNVHSSITGLGDYASLEGTGLAIDVAPRTMHWLAEHWRVHRPTA